MKLGKVSAAAGVRWGLVVGALTGGVLTALGQAQPEPPPAWEKSAALGLTLTRGNSDTVLFTGNVLGTRKSKVDEWTLGADAAYGKNQDVKNNETLHGFVQYNRLFTENWYGYGRLDGLHDGVADLEYRFTFSPGVGYYFIKNENRRLSLEGGPAFIYEKQGPKSRGYLAFRAGEKFEQKLNDKTKIWQTLEFLPQVDRLSNYILNGEIGVDTALTQKLSLRSFLQDSFDNEPAPGRKKNDLKLVTALAYKF
jgi:putative salt-induced outer membrane protein YdiY